MKNKPTKSEAKKILKEANEIIKSYHITHGLERALNFLSKELTINENHVRGIKKWENEKNNYNTQKIQIGGGKHVLEDFLNIDIVPPADLICDVREGIPLRDSCSELIFSEHFFEHVDYPKSSKKLVLEFFRILKDGGQVILGVPDSEMMIENYVSRNKKFYKKAIDTWYRKRNCLEHFNTYIDLVNYHFRDQDDDKKYNPHYWSYDFEKLESLFKNAGFNRVEKWDFDSSIANPKRYWGSIYIIATKTINK